MPFTIVRRRALFKVVFLLLINSVCLHGQRSCSLGRFCQIGVDCNSVTNGCVETCPTESDHMVQGNWSNGNCERGKLQCIC